MSRLPFTFLKSMHLKTTTKEASLNYERNYNEIAVHHKMHPLKQHVLRIVQSNIGCSSNSFFS